MFSTLQYPALHVSRGSGVTRIFYVFFKLAAIKRNCLWEIETVHL